MNRSERSTPIQRGAAMKTLQGAAYVDGRTIGLLTVGSPDGEQLGERDLTVLRAVTDRLAAALALALERDLIAARGRRFGRLSAVARELGAAAYVGDDNAFWCAIAMAVGGTRSSGVTLLGSVPDLAAAAFERASGALELARRLGPGNTVAA